MATRAGRTTIIRHSSSRELLSARRISERLRYRLGGCEPEASKVLLGYGIGLLVAAWNTAAVR